MGLVTVPIDLRLLEQVWPTPHLPEPEDEEAVEPD